MIWLITILFILLGLGCLFLVIMQLRVGRCTVIGDAV